MLDTLFSFDFLSDNILIYSDIMLFSSIMLIGNVSIGTVDGYPPNVNCHITILTIQTLTHWGRDNMAAISQTTLSKAFSWMKIYEYD